MTNLTKGGEARPRRRATVRALGTFLRCPERARIECEAGLRLASSGDRPWPPNLRDALAWALGAADLAIVAPTAAGSPTAEIARGVAHDALLHWTEACTSVAPRTRPGEPTAAEQIAEVYGKGAPIVERALRVLPPLLVARDRKGRPILHRLVDLGIPGPTGRPSGCRVVVPLDGIVVVHRAPWALVRYYTNTVEPSDVRFDLMRDLDLRPAVAAAAAIVAEDGIPHPVVGALVEVVRLRAPSEVKTVNCRKNHAAGPDPACAECRGTGIGRLSAADADTTVDEWEAALARHPHLDAAAERARAAGLLGRLQRRGESFCYRVEVPVDAYALRAWAADVRATFRLLATARRSGWPRNPGACDVPPCPYRAVCADRLDRDAAPFRATTPSWLTGLERFSWALDARASRRYRWPI
jgi:hypothetical protein